MKNILFLCLPGLLFMTSVVNAQSWAWAKKDVGTGSTYANAIATDVSGNIVVAGEVYIAKYNSSGSQLWKKDVASGFTGRATGVCADASGNIYVAGTYSTSITFGATTLTAAGNSDMFVVKYDAGGSVSWAMGIGGVGIDGGVAITADASGDIYVTGSFNSPSMNVGTITITSAGTSAFLARVTSSGAVTWAKSLANGAFCGIRSVATDNAGGIFVAGSFSQSNLTIGSTTLTTADFYPHVFVARYDASGNPTWAKGAASSYYDGAYAVGADAAGNSYVVGSFTGSSIAFGSITLTNSSTGTMDAFAASYDPSGNVRWAKRAGGAGMDEVLGAAADNAGNLFIAGGFSGATFDIGSISLANTAASDFDIVVAKYNSSGAEQWAIKTGGTGGESAHGLAVCGDGSVYVNGAFNSGTLSFDGNVLTHGGGFDDDVFVARLAGVNSIPLVAENNGGVRLYPNPAKEEIIVTAEISLTEVAITDVAGRTVIRTGNHLQALHIDIRSLAKGVYFLNVNNAGSRPFVKE